MSVRMDNEKEFISLFNSIARGTRRLQVFTDFISCSVIALQNGLQFCEKREKKYMAIGKRLTCTVLRFIGSAHFTLTAQVMLVSSNRL